MDCSGGPRWSDVARMQQFVQELDAELEEVARSTEERKVRARITMDKSRIWRMRRRSRQKRTRFVFTKPPRQERQVFGPHFVGWLGAAQDILHAVITPRQGNENVLTIEIPESSETWLDSLIKEATE